MSRAIIISLTLVGLLFVGLVTGTNCPSNGLPEGSQDPPAFPEGSQNPPAQGVLSGTWELAPFSFSAFFFARGFHDDPPSYVGGGSVVLEAMTFDDEDRLTSVRFALIYKGGIMGAEQTLDSVVMAMGAGGGVASSHLESNGSGGPCYCADDDDDYNINYEANVSIRMGPATVSASEALVSVSFSIVSISGGERISTWCGESQGPLLDERQQAYPDTYPPYPWTWSMTAHFATTDSNVLDGVVTVTAPERNMDVGDGVYNILLHRQ